MADSVLSPCPLTPGRAGSAYQDNSTVPSDLTVQRWDGNERTSTEWNSLRRDSEIWFEDGSCYVYLYQRGQSRRGPSFRVPYELLVSSACNELIDRYMISTWNSSPYSASCPGGDCYLYLHAPPELSRGDALQYHIDTRNFFAWLVGVPLVGTDPISALIRLKDRMDLWRDRPADNLEALIDYIKLQGYCDLPEPMEESFTKKVAGLPAPRKARDGLKKMFRLSAPTYGRRMSELLVGATPRKSSLSRRPVSTFFSSITSSSSSLEKERVNNHIASVDGPKYGRKSPGNTRHSLKSDSGSSSSEASSSPPSLSYSGEDTLSTWSSRSSLVSTESQSSSPITPFTADEYSHDIFFDHFSSNDNDHHMDDVTFSNSNSPTSASRAILQNTKPYKHSRATSITDIYFNVSQNVASLTQEQRQQRQDESIHHSKTSRTAQEVMIDSLMAELRSGLHDD